MDIVNIRKKAKQEKEKKGKIQETTEEPSPKPQDEVEPEPEIIREGEVIPCQEKAAELPALSGVVETSERIFETPSPQSTPLGGEGGEGGFKKETYEIPSVTHGEEEDTVEIVSFNLGEETYGVKIDHVKEILKPLEITPVPRTPDYLEGVTSLRGEIIPVFDLKKRLGLESIKEERKRRILILSVRNETMGALIDKVSGVVKLRRDSIEPPPTIITGTEADFLEGVSRIDDKFIGLLNIEEVMKI